VRICAHFFSNGAWLEEDQLLRNASKLAGIPAVLAHGRHDDAALPRHQNRAIWATLRA
jgi:hypothetical protein